MNESRRNFLNKAALGVGGVSLFNASTPGQAVNPNEKPQRLPREVWVATLTQHELTGTTVKQVVQKTVKAMESIRGYQPDIICLPEAFHVAGLPKEPPLSSETAETPIGHITQPLADFAKQHKCYVIAPVYTQEAGRYYNTAVLIDREGKYVGGYKKMRPTEGEINDLGFTPGPLEVPVFETDLGKIGVQICFDIEWMQGWQQLKEKGADMVFWPSAFAGGKKVEGMAWLHKFPVISSTRKGASKICDLTGEVVAQSGQYNLWGVCAPLNLEKVLLHSWPYAYRFLDIHQQYGDRVRTYTLHEEEFSVLESRDPALKVADIMKEYDLISYEENKQRAEAAQQKYWNQDSSSMR